MPERRPVAALDDHLGYWLRIVSNRVSQNFARKLDAEGVTVAEWVFLRVLYDFDALAPTVLAERMAMTKGAISKLGNRLVEKRLVAREANSGDRRAQTVALTQKGRALLPRLAKAADENDMAFFHLLTPADRKTLDRIMRRLVELHGLKDVPTN